MIPEKVTILDIVDIYTGSRLQRVKRGKRISHYEWMLVVTECFSIAVNLFDVKKSACYNWVLVVTKLVLRRAQCNMYLKKHMLTVLKSKKLFLVGRLGGPCKTSISCLQQVLCTVPIP